MEDERKTKSAAKPAVRGGVATHAATSADSARRNAAVAYGAQRYTAARTDEDNFVGDHVFDINVRALAREGTVSSSKHADFAAGSAAASDAADLGIDTSGVAIGLGSRAPALQDLSQWDMRV